MSSRCSDHEESSLTVLNGSEIKNEPQLKCFRSTLQSVEFMTRSELFRGFDTIKAITFSYDINFIETILGQFQYGEIILGADYLVQKDTRLCDLLKSVLTNSYEAAHLIRSHQVLAEMLKNEDVVFRTPTFVLDHRKIYLLKSDDGKRTRVIKASANMSNSAWNGDHMEFYDYDDSAACYEEYEKDFETAWENSQDIPYSVISGKKSDDIMEGNPIIEKVKETDTAIILQQPVEPSIENVKYVIDHEAIGKKYEELLSDVKIKAKNGFIEVSPKTVELFEHNFKKIWKKIKVHNVTEHYPLMTIDYGTGEVLLNEVSLDLRPTEGEVRNDIELLLEIFNNFDHFVGDSEILKESHYKMMNAIFASPFHAKVRCAAKIRDFDAASLPLYLLAASSTANCGKTFMISAALKMMTGKKLEPQKGLKKEEILGLQEVCKGIPVFIDEIDSMGFSRIKDLIKNPERCENNQIETMPMLIFASNNILEPDETLRKRMAFLRFNAKLPSNIDQSAYSNKGKALQRKLGTGFYREYLRRMIEKVSNELEYIMTEPEIPDEYYPDLMEMSSTTIIEIFERYGYQTLPCMRRLTWNDDYSINASFISDDAITAIEALLKQNRKAFTLKRDTIIMEIGNSKDSRKMCESWANTLPSEIDAKVIPLKDCIRITLNRKEFESRIGHKLGGFSFFQKG